MSITPLIYHLDRSGLVQGEVDKLILRNAARGIVPDDIIDRPKAGFGAPYRKWLRYDLQELWQDVTSRESIAARGWFDYDAVQNVRKVSQAGKADLYMLQWAIITVELWDRQFIDGEWVGGAFSLLCFWTHLMCCFYGMFDTVVMYSILDYCHEYHCRFRLSRLC
ncbi:MAG: hypothetical protein DRQ97_14010 [Gammaproteobacteria bacterium]|nr:MAG: hypothetical protein DRQ97_14010 [Gammaproteobacteria bacterium]